MSYPPSYPPPPPNPYLNQAPGQPPGQLPGHTPTPYPLRFGGYPQETPLQLPAYGIGFGGAVKRAFQKYVDFGGRASLSEYWWFILFNHLASFAMLCFFMAVSVSTMDPVTEEPSGLAVLALLLWAGTAIALVLPTLAVASRRLHDANLSGALLFLYLVPGVGSLVIAILCLFPSTPAGARFDAGFTAYPAHPAGGY